MLTVMLRKSSTSLWHLISLVSHQLSLSVVPTQNQSSSEYPRFNSSRARNLIGPTFTNQRGLHG
jgi:hypothetical protein